MPRVGLQALVLGRALGLVRLPLVELDVQKVLVVVLVAHRAVLEDLRLTDTVTRRVDSLAAASTASMRRGLVKTASRRRGLKDASDATAYSLTRRTAPTWSETAQNHKRDHPRPPLLETSRVDCVEAPQHRGTPSSAPPSR